MKRAVLLVMVAFAALPSYVAPQTEEGDSIKQKVLGTWKLVSYIREEIPPGAKSDVMGAHPSGYINYGRDGRVIVMIAGSNRKRPVGAVPTPSEAEALIKSMIAYAGTYTLDTKAQTVTHHIDVSWNESYTGTAQVRNYKFESNRLILTTVPSPDPATGKITARTLIWERLE